MASELKPWKYEIKYGPEGEDAYSWVYDDHGAMVATMKTHKAKQIVDTMNTRPAPAATDTGLVTVAYQYKLKRNGHWDNLPSDWTADECKAYDKQETRELVTRSQSVGLLAAERAEKEEWKRRAEYAERELANSILKRRLLEADNAAKAARIKELEDDLKTFQDGTADLVNEKIDAEFKAVDLEAKLAAATELLRQSRQSLKRAPFNLFKDIDDFLAALGGKPS